MIIEREPDAQIGVIMRVEGAGVASLDHVFSILEEMLIHDYLS